MPDRCDVVVDLSNVCRDESLGYSAWTASWARWGRLRTAWIRESGRTETSFFLVADDGLYGRLSQSDQVKLDTERSRGLLDSAPSADPLLLELGIRWGAVVLSCDAFNDLRKTPGIDRLSVMHWQASTAGIQFKQRDMTVPLSVVISRRGVRQQVKARGLNSRSPELQRHWYCDDKACGKSDVLIPDLRSGAAKCPDCGAYLRDGGPWRSPLVVKVMLAGEQRGALLLEEGEQLLVGRGGAADVVDVGSFADAESSASVSRRHLRLTNDQGRLFAEDLGSSNGTRVAHAVKGQRRWTPKAPWKPHIPRALGEGDRLYLGDGGVFIELSGWRPSD